MPYKYGIFRQFRPFWVFLTGFSLVLMFGKPLHGQNQEPAFPGLVGPGQISVLPTPEPESTSPSRYGTGGSNSLAIVLRDTGGSWLGLVHSLKSIGIPLKVYLEVEPALAHDVVLVYPSLTGANTSPAMLKRLANHVREGKTLIGFSVLGGGLSEVFGYETYKERNDLRTFNVNGVGLTSPVTFELERSEMNLVVENQKAAGVSYYGLKHPAIATYDDGTAAITHNFYEHGGRIGQAIAVGFDFGHFALKAQNGRLANGTGSYVNGYDSGTDSIMRFIAAVYWQGESNSVQVLSSPYNKEFTALITHDIDYTESMQNIQDYLQLESSFGVPATYFIQTKYVTDYNDSQFLNEQSRSIVEQLVAHSMEVASHSVAHSNEFRNMPAGSGEERYPQYQPFVKDFETVQNATITGELRVSKFLLEELGGQTVKSFRPGHLSLPRALPELLEATGYQYSSSITANEARTHLPYQTMFNSEYSSETPVFEFPVTIEDEQGRLGDRLDDSITLANRIGQHGGLVNLLIHTDVTDHKLEFERRFIEEFVDRAWFSTVTAFGDWWRMRDSLVIDVTENTPQSRELSIKVAGAVEGLTLRIPHSWRLQTKVAGIHQVDNTVVLDKVTHHTQITFQVP